jgi:amino acid adenylation domain-containing protein
MSNLEMLLSSLRKKGFNLWLEEGQLRYRAPKNALAPELLADIRAKREEIVAFLQQAKRSVTTGSQRLLGLPRPEHLPLSYAQQRLWFLEQLGLVGSGYNLPAALKLEGDLEFEALERSFSEIIRRHESLRTRFDAVDGQGVQVIDEPGDFHLELVDLSTLGEEEKREEAKRLVQEDAERPFDLVKGPLLRAKLLRLGARQHVVIVNMHHIVSDGWSMGVLTRELGTLYSAYVENRPSPLEELSIQYADYALWQRGWLEREVLGEQVSYWKERLEGAPAALDLPSDRVRPTVQSFRGATLSFGLSEEVSRGLVELSSQEGATLYMVLLAAFQTLLSRYSGQEDIVVGSPIAGRQRRELEGLIGIFVNTLVLRTDLSGDPSFIELLGRVKETALGAYAHQDLPVEKLVEELKPVRDLSRQPLFQVVFALQNVPQEKLVLPGLELNQLTSEQVTTKFDLSLYMFETPAGLQGLIEYATDLFERSTIERLIGHFENLLSGVLATPENRISELTLLNEAERRQLLVEWNDTAADYPREKCIQELFAEQAAKTPASIALVFGDEQLSYAELDCRSNQLAHHLRRLGVGPEVVVGLCVERSLEMVIGLLGILKAGGAYLPLDPSYPQERLSYMLKGAQTPVLVTQAALIGQLPLSDAQLVRLDEDWKVIGRQPANIPNSGVVPDNLAYVIYTSGSTGDPKGVMVKHQGLSNYLCWSARYYSPEGSVVSSSLSFDATITSLLTPLCVGSAVRLLGEKRELDGLEEQVLRGCGLIKITPSHLEVLGQKLSNQGRSSSVGILVVGGEALPASTVALWRKVQPNVRMVNEYGPTETVVGCVVEEISSQVDLDRLVPIGRPIANTRIYILDRNGEPVPIGVVGELYVGGKGVARGYLKQPELTAKSFVRDRFTKEANAQMYKTGDLGRWLADGRIEFLGRNDSQVKVRGYRIELGEIEAALVANPGAEQAVVIVREDSPGEKRLVGYVVGSGDEALEAGQLRTYLKQSLPEYTVPSAFVMLDALPLTPNGKLDRKALPAPEDRSEVGTYVAPRTLLEEEIASLWAEVLKLDRVGVEDNFFELGGHSLLAVKLLERMRQKGLEAEVRTLFMAPTVAELAVAMNNSEGKKVVVPPNGIPEQCELITPAMLPLVDLTPAEIERIVGCVVGGISNVQDIYPLAPLQEGMLFHHLLASEADPYLAAHITSFKSRERLDRYLKALQAVIDRHDILRTAVIWGGLSEPVQVVWRKAVLPIEEIVLEPEAGEAAEELYRRVDPQHYQLDLRAAPLVRGYMAYDAAGDRWLLLMLHHHLAVDHTTLEIIQGEIWAHLLGQEEQLAAPLPFRNLVAQARFGVSEQEHEVFFRRMLGDVTEPTIPFGLTEVRGDGRGIEQQRLTVKSELAERLRTVARKLGVSAASLFHLAFAQVLARVSGRGDVVFGTVLFGRMQGGEGAESVMGVFMNTLPIRIEIGKDNLEASVRRTHAKLAELLAHEHASLALAQRCSGVPAPAPLFSALFNYRYSQSITAMPSSDVPDESEGGEFLGAHTHTNYPLTLSVDDLGDGFELTAQTDGAVVKAMRMCQFMHAALEELIGALESDSQRTLMSLDVLPAAERHQMLVEWNATGEEYPREKCVHELFAEQVAKTPEAIALVFEEERLSYAELDRRANQLAHYLQRLGVGPEVVVGLCVERSLEMMVGLLGILKAGGAYLPLDPNYPKERLAYMLEHAQATALVTQGALIGQLPCLDAEVVRLDEDWEKIDQRPVSLPQSGVRPGNLAYLLYTSGSTGLAKGVLMEHRNFASYLCWCIHACYDQAGSGSPIVHSIAFSGVLTTLFGPLVTGQALTLPPAGSEAETVAAGLNGPYTLVKVTPSHLKLLNLALEMSGAPSPTRALMIGGEGLIPSDLGFWQRRFPSVRLIAHYGSSEVMGGCCGFEITDNVAEASSIPIGRPIGNTRVYVLDSNLEPVPVGVPGELYIAGPGLARGYLKQPALSAERFMADPNGPPGTRMYRTGDLVRWRTEGVLDFLGRADQQLKIRGFRIEPGEIEAALLSNPMVAQVAVIVREDNPGDQRLVAYVAKAEGAAPEARELGAYLKQRLPAYMLPSAFVMLDAMPLTPNGKLDRKALPAPEGRPEVGAYVAPQTLNEDALAAIWADVLKLDRVGLEDSFFELGGHSLLATRVVARIRDIFEVEVPLRALFEAPTVRLLAERVEEMQREGSGVAFSPLVAQPRGEVLPLSYVQERLWLVQQRDRDSGYNMGGALVMDGPLSIEALEAALKGLIQRHEPLRTRFVLKAGESAPQQYIDSSAEVMLSVRQVRWEEVNRLVKEHAEQIFDLEQGPQLSVLVLEVGPEKHVLSLAMHHIIGDGWSVHVLVRDLQELYAAAREGRKPRLEELKIQYADYALWQRQQDLSEALGYWSRALEGYAGPFNLAPEKPRGKRAGRAGVLKRTLPPGLASELGCFSQERRASLFMVLLSGWVLTVHRQTRRKDLCLGATVAGRDQLALEPLIGFFINILGLRLDLTGKPTGEELVEQVKEVVFRGLAHQAVPFEQLLVARPELRQEDGVSLLPVMVRHQNYPEAELQKWAGGVEARPLLTEQMRRARSDLDLQYYGGADGLSVVAEFDTERLDLERVEALLEESEELLERLIQAPQWPLWRLVEPSSEDRAKLDRWNDAVQAFEQTSVRELFERQAERNREGLACVDSEQALSYGELDRRSDNLARVLREQGVRPGVRVALYLPRSAGFLTALVAVFKARGVYVPVDRSYPEAYAQRMIEDAAPAIILVESGFAPGFTIAHGKVLTVEETLLKQDWEPLEEEAVTGPDELAYIAYTSGSTGQPKGVCVEHRQLLNCLQALWKQMPFEVDEVVAQKTATTFVVSLKELLSGLLAGIPQVIIPDLLVRDTEAFPAELERRRVTRLNLVPSQLTVLLEHAEQLKGLRHVVTAGEPLGQSLRERFEQLLPNARLYNNYGCTELNDISYCVPGEQEGEEGLVPMGRPIRNLRLHVLDEQQRLVPVGVAGELYVEGEAVGGRGYWNHPALTAERFVPDPFEGSGSRLFRTGDLVRRRADGQLQFLGRDDFQIKIRGQRIDPAQVEQALGEYPAIERCAVMGQGSGTQRTCLVVYYVAAPDAKLDYNQLYDWLKERLPSYMVPSIYVPLERLPLLPNGKLDRLALPAVDAEAYGQDKHQQPEGETERNIAAIWAEVLNLPIERIGRHDNFFASGGHSLLAARIINRIRSTLSVNLPIRVLFEAPTVAGLALSLLEQTFQTAAAISVLLPIRVHGTYPPLFCIHPGPGLSWSYFNLVQYLDDRPVYGLQARGLDGVTPLAPTLEAMVSDYIDQIRIVQPNGPYHLLGWSFGGVVAQAMAAQFECDGETVALLALIDPHPCSPRNVRELSKIDEQEQEKRFLALVTSRYGEEFTSSIGRSLLKNLLNVMKNDFRILRESSSPTYQGDALLFRATESSEASTPILCPQAWDPYVLGEIEVHDIHCLHDDMDRPQPMAEIGYILAHKLKLLT